MAHSLKSALPLQRIDYFSDFFSFKFWVHPNDDHYLAYRNGTLSDWEKDTISCFVMLASKARVFVDIGAYCGIYSVIAKSVNRSLEVIVIEPNKVLLPTLKKNLGGDESTIAILNIALAQTCGGAYLVSPRNNKRSSANFIVQEPNSYDSLYYAKRKIDIHRLDCDSLPSGIKEVDLIKIDAEGSELSILIGFTSILRERKPVLFLEANSEDTKNELKTFLQSLGYKIFRDFDKERMFVAQ